MYLGQTRNMLLEMIQIKKKKVSSQSYNQWGSCAEMLKQL